MASPIHEVIEAHMEAHPEVLSYLLELQGEAPSGALVPATATRTKALTLEQRVDRAFLIGSREAPEAFVLVELQLDPDDDKRYSWPLYIELARSRYRCEGAPVVLTVAPGVRDWVERDIAPRTGRYGATRQLTPVVIALEQIEPALLLRPDRAYLAPLAVAVHAKTPAAREVARAAMDITMERLPRHVATDQLNVILGMVDAALRAHLKGRIAYGRRLRTSYLNWLCGKASYAYQVRREAEREARGWAKSILLVLDARRIKVSPAITERILACTDVEVLEQWMRRAAVVSTAAEVVEAEAAPQAAAKEPVRRARKAA